MGSGYGDIPRPPADPSQRRYVQERGWTGKPTAPRLTQGPVKDQEAKAPFRRMPNWVNPPLNAYPLDLYTNPTVVLPVATANTAVLTYNVGPGVIAVLRKFGNDLENLAAFLQVTWRFLWKTNTYTPQSIWFAGPVRTNTWLNFQRSLGNPVDPTELCSPITLVGPGVFVLEADNADVIQHFADARFMGYEWLAAQASPDLHISDQYMT